MGMQRLNTSPSVQMPEEIQVLPQGLLIVGLSASHKSF